MTKRVKKKKKKGNQVATRGRRSLSYTYSRYSVQNISKDEKDKPIKKRAKDLNRCFVKAGLWVPNNIMKRCSASSGIKPEGDTQIHPRLAGRADAQTGPGLGAVARVCAPAPEDLGGSPGRCAVRLLLPALSLAPPWAGVLGSSLRDGVPLQTGASGWA